MRPKVRSFPLPGRWPRDKLAACCNDLRDWRMTATRLLLALDA